MALFPGTQHCIVNRTWLNGPPSLLPEILPADSRFAEVVHVHRVDSEHRVLAVDGLSQQVLCCRRDASGFRPRAPGRRPHPHP